MTDSLGEDARYHILLTVRDSSSSVDSMSSHRTGYSSGSYGYGSGSGLNAYSTSRRGSGTGHRQYANLCAPQIDTNSRRRSMAIQDMLNPAGRDEGYSSGSQSSPSSSENERRPSGSYRHLPDPRPSSRAPRSVPHSRRSTTSHMFGSGSRRPSLARQPSRRSPSTSPDVQPRTRSFRPTYTTEEGHFIWYLRIDRGYLWPDIQNAFNARFSHGAGDRRRTSGLQCRYYRLLDQNGLPKVRNIPRTADVVQRYGMRANLARAGQHLSYSW